MKMAAMGKYAHRANHQQPHATRSAPERHLVRGFAATCLVVGTPAHQHPLANRGSGQRKVTGDEMALQKSFVLDRKRWMCRARSLQVHVRHKTFLQRHLVASYFALTRTAIRQ